MQPSNLSPSYCSDYQLSDVKPDLGLDKYRRCLSLNPNPKPGRFHKNDNNVEESIMEKSFAAIGLEDHGESSNNGEDKIICPCHHYNSMTKVEEVLRSSEQVKAMIQWLDGETDAEALLVQKILSCGKRSRCRYRYGTSFAILNCIRDVCRTFLEPQHGEATKQQNLGPSLSRPEFTAASFESTFPPLGGSDEGKNTSQFKPHPAASNILIPRKKSKMKKEELSFARTNTNTVTTLVGKKKKKRIRPQLTQTTTVPQISVWGQQSSKLGNKDGNISKLTVKNHMISLESRMSGGKDNEAPTKVSNAWAESKTAVVKSEKSRAVALPAVSAKPNVDQLSNVVQPKPVSESPDSHVSRLIEIYISLIKNMLIPSTAMELHLLIRLLTVDGENCEPVMAERLETAGVFFRSIFSSPERCNTFATNALSELSDIIENLSLPLLQSLIQCVPFRNKCSSLADRLSVIVQEHIGRGLGVTEEIGGTHAILSLPFEAGRDSRHNYKTQAEMSIYKNREETRDLFLHQLRVYMSEKGKGFQSQDMENAKENLRRESRKIIGKIFSVNMPWFAEFLCKLLLQVGLSPVQESDEELLNIADKDKLQKLHKRFSSRTSHTNKSSKKLVLAKRKEATAGSPWMEAQTSFPGYQEFFFIFLLSADSYNLGVHFRNHLVATILRLSADHEVNHLEKRILDLQILARFLGFLIFSPNWHDGGLELTKMYPDDRAMRVSGGMQQLDWLGLSCIAIIEESWLHGYSLLTVPWTTELLRMAKWDSLSLSSRECRQVLANLRAIQSRLRIVGTETMRRFGPSMQLVSFSLESLFESITGLPKLTSLPVDNLPEAKDLPEKCLDVTTLGLGMGSMIASSQHIEDLSNLIKSMNSSSIGRTPTKARKLRPSIVSRGLSVAPDKVTDESPLKMSTGNEWQPSTRASWHELGRKGKEDTQRRLQDAFFHQNHGLKEICEFAVGQVIKKTINQKVLQVYCKDAFDQHSIHLFSSEKDIEEAQTHAMELSNGCLKQNLHHSVETTLKALGPSNLHDKVLEVATSLAMTSGMQTGQPLLRALVLNESDGYMNALKREEKKQLPRKVLTFDEDEPSLDDVIFSLGALHDYLDKNETSKWDVHDIVQRIESATVGLVKFEASMGSAIPEEFSLRKLFGVLFNLDAMSVDFLDWCLALDAVNQSVVLPKYFQLAVHFSKHTSFGLRNLSAHIDGKILKSLLVSWPEGSVETMELSSLLSDMENAGIVHLELLLTGLKAETSSRAADILSIIERAD